MSKPQIEEYNPVDGKFFLVNRKDGSLFAKTWSKGDATLLSAAPDLLAACKTTLARIRNTNINTPIKDMVDTWDLLRAAIARAEHA